MGIETYTLQRLWHLLSGTQSTRYMGIETFNAIIFLRTTCRHNLLAIWVLKLAKLISIIFHLYDTIYSLYGYWNLYEFCHCVDVLCRHNLLAIWVLKLADCPLTVFNLFDTIYSLYGYWNFIISFHPSWVYRHNLLAIWVLKLAKLISIIFHLYDTIYSLYGYWNCIQVTWYIFHHDTIYSLYGYWNWGLMWL